MTRACSLPGKFLTESEFKGFRLRKMQRPYILPFPFQNTSTTQETE